MNFIRYGLLCALLCHGLTLVRADDPPPQAPPAPAPKEITLKPGDKAPGLKVGKWLGGEPVKSLEKDKIYVLEFWATWCGPCVASIPHVNEIHEKFKDKSVVILGVNVDEDEAEVEKFMEENKKSFKYRIVRDDADRGMSKSWLDAAGRSGIPCSMIVDQNGKLAWIGHPQKMERPLKKIIDKKWDIEAEAKAEALREAEMEKLETELHNAVQKREADAVLTTIDKMAKVDEDVADDIDMKKYMVLLQINECEKAYAMGDKVLAKYKDDAETLTELAWIILDKEATGDGILPKLNKRDYDLALKFAERANVVSKGESYETLHILAQAYAEKDQIDKAIETQKLALKKADPNDKELVEELKDNLKVYEDKKNESVVKKADDKKDK